MKKPRVKKPRIDELPEHIAKVGVSRRGMIIDIQPNILLVSDESEDLPPDPIADPKW